MSDCTELELTVDQKKKESAIFGEAETIKMIWSKTKNDEQSSNENNNKKK